MVASYPADLRYTREHEWARVEGNRAWVGITHVAREQPGDVVFVESDAKELGSPMNAADYEAFIATAGGH